MPSSPSTCQLPSWVVSSMLYTRDIPWHLPPRCSASSTPPTSSRTSSLRRLSRWTWPPSSSSPPSSSGWTFLTILLVNSPREYAQCEWQPSQDSVCQTGRHLADICTACPLDWGSVLMNSNLGKNWHHTKVLLHTAMDLMRTEEDEEGGEEDGKGREVGLIWPVFIYRFQIRIIIKSVPFLGKPPWQDYHCWCEEGCGSRKRGQEQATDSGWISTATTCIALDKLDEERYFSKYCRTSWLFKDLPRAPLLVLNLKTRWTRERWLRHERVSTRMQTTFKKTTASSKRSNSQVWNERKPLRELNSCPYIL